MMLGFAYEADMLTPIAQNSKSIIGANGVVRFEVASADGVPDVVFAILNKEVIASRGDTGYLTDPTKLAVMYALSRMLGSEGYATTSQLSVAVGVSSRHLALKVLPYLQDIGFILRFDRDRWIARSVLQSPVERLVTVEAKVRDWRKGLGQAARHAAGADESWLVLDSRFSNSALNARESFQTNSVGLATLSSTGHWQTLIRPCPRATLGLRRELLAERVAQMAVSGEVVGPMPAVFGKQLRATRAIDPRLVDA